MRLHPDEARNFTIKTLITNGLSKDDAVIIADHLIEAELCGRASHGLLRIPQIIEKIPQNTQKAEIVKNAPAYALLDGTGELGYLVAYQAVNIALEKAQTTGIALVGVKNSGHCGMAGYYVRQIVARGYIGIMLCNTFPKVALAGGRKPAYGTNPLAVAIPAEPENFVLDMSTASMTIGDLFVALREGKELPPGFVYDEDDNPVTNPAEALKNGVLQPFGGYKGAGLGVMIQLLSAILTGHDAWQTGGILLAAIDSGIFSSTDDLRKKAGDYFKKIKDAENSEVYLPGEHSAARRKEIIKTGIFIEDTLYQSQIQNTLPGTPI